MSPYIGWRLPTSTAALTDRSVYVSVKSHDHRARGLPEHRRRRRGRRRHRSAPGPRGSCGRRASRRGAGRGRDGSGCGASIRASGMVRAQGGTETAVRLGLFSRDFYLGQHEHARASTRASSSRATSCRASARPRSRRRTQRIAMQQALGLDVSWVEPGRGGRLQPRAGARADPRCVVRRRRRLHRAAAQRAGLHRRTVHLGVHVAERTTFTGPAGLTAARVTRGGDDARARSRPSGS